MHFIHDVCESICLLFSYKPFLLKLKFLLCIYLLISDFIFLQPGLSSAAFASESSNSTTSDRKPAPPKMRRKVIAPQSGPHEGPLQLARNAKCRKLFVNLEKNRQSMCLKEEEAVSHLGYRSIFAKPLSPKPGEKAAQYLMLQKPKTQCEIPGYFTPPSLNFSNNLDTSSREKDFNFFLLKPLSNSTENSKTGRRKDGNEKLKITVDEVCSELFNSSNFQSEISSAENDSYIDVLKSARLPFCGAYNVQIENNAESDYPSVEDRETDDTFFKTCWGSVDLKLTLFDILVANSQEKTTTSSDSKISSGGVSAQHYSLKLNKHNCGTVLHKLLLKDYQASASFYALFVPALARFDCRVQSDYSVDAYCFSCAVSNEFSELLLLLC